MERQNFQDTVDEFLSMLIITLTTASAYPLDHPYFRRYLDAAYSLLKAVMVSTHEFVLVAHPQKVVVEGIPQVKDESSKKLSSYLHLRKIQYIKIKSDVTVDELFKLVEALSFSIKELEEKGGISQVLDQKATPSIEVGKLDYSYLLQEETGDVLQIFTIILSRELNELSGQDMERIEKSIRDMEKFFRKVRAISDKLSHQDLLDGLSKLANVVKTKFPEKQKEFFKKLLTFFLELDENTLAKVKGAKSFHELKDSAKNFLGKDDFSEVVSDLLTKKRSPSLTVDLLSLFEDAIDDPSLTNLVTEKLFKKGLRDTKEVRESFKEMLTYDTTHKFISGVYQEFLKLAFESGSKEKKSTSVLEQYRQELTKENVQKDYFYMLMDVLYSEREDSKDIDSLSKKVFEDYDFLSPEEKLEVFHRLGPVIKKSLSSEESDIPKHFAKVIEILYTDKAIDFVLDDIFSLKEEELPIVSRLILSQKGKVNEIINLFFSDEKDGSHRAERILSSIPDDKIVGLFKVSMEEGSEAEDSFSQTLKIITFLSRVNTEEAAKLLVDIFRKNEKDRYVQVKVLESLKQNTHTDTDFLFSLLLSPDYHLRENAATNIAGLHNSEFNNRAAGVLFDSKRFSFNQIEENVKIVSRVGMEEAVGALEEIVLRKCFLFFNPRMKRLKIEAYRALESVAPQKAKEVTATHAFDGSVRYIKRELKL